LVIIKNWLLLKIDHYLTLELHLMVSYWIQMEFLIQFLKLNVLPLLFLTTMIEIMKKLAILWCGNNEETSNIMMWKYLNRRPHGKIPVQYVPQLMAEMFVTKLSNCRYCSGLWFPNEYIWREIWWTLHEANYILVFIDLFIRR